MIQNIDCGDPDGTTVERGALAFYRAKTFPSQRIVHQAESHFAIALQSDGNAKLRIAMSEVGRSIQWIDDPTVLALRALVIGFFLRQNRMVGEIALDDFNDLALRLAVNRRNQIDSALEIDLFGL